MPDLPLPPGSTIGVVGGGQLGRMLSQAASRLGFDVVILDPEENSPAGRVSRGQVVAAYDDPTALTVLGRVCQVVTFEFENVPAASMETLAEGGALVAPGPTALKVAQDRVEEKLFLNAVGAPTVDYHPVDGLDYVGVIGVELFDLSGPGDDGGLRVNEIAPRVHNTGHWTQDGCVCDQFEQHIRAIAGWPLGPTTAHARVEMTNLLGDEVEQWSKLAAKPDARLHLYGKAEARPGRKMAHVNRIKPLPQA